MLPGVGLASYPGAPRRWHWHLQKLTNLSILDNLTGPIPPSLAGLTKLTKLKVEDTANRLTVHQRLLPPRPGGCRQECVRLPAAGWSASCSGNIGKCAQCIMPLPARKIRK
jgi:hypothetical protein